MQNERLQKSYIGRMTKAFEKRTKEHWDNVKKEPQDHTIITKHLLVDHEIHWENVKLFDEE